MDKKNYGIMMSLGLVGIGIGIASEISRLWTVEQNWVRLLSLMGKLTISLYLLLLFLGLYFLFKGVWRVELLNGWARQLKLPSVVPSSLVVGLLLVFTYFYLYSVWQTILAQPWIQLLFAMAFAQILLFIVAPQREQRWGGRELALAIGLFLYPRVVQETRALFTDATVYRAVTLAGFVVILALIFILYSSYGEKLRFALLAWRERLGPARVGIIVLLSLTPIVHRYLVDPETYILYDDIRFLILIIAVWLVAYLGLMRSEQLVSLETLGLSLGALLFTSFLARASLLIIDYPFALSWSEGNRFYDYSLVFGQSLYNYPGRILNPYSSPGRYGLWGVLFLWPGLPIWAHRLWNLFLLTLPVLLFSALVTRKLRPAALRYAMLLWITLFLTVLAPLHPPFVIASVIAVSFAFDESLIKRGSSLALASFYAGISRWTWVFAPAAIGVLIDLMLYYPKRSGDLWRRLAPSLLLGGISLIAGILPSIGQYFSLVQGEALSSGQALLWYRLLPNDTLGPGVLFLALRYTLPLWIILGWWLMTDRWQLDWIQMLAVLGTLIGFFAIGLVISTKIGGGGDLHNLDMFLVTLLVVTVLGLMSVDRSPIPGKWSAWMVGLICLLVFWVAYPFLPLYPGSDYHPLLQLPNENKVSEAFSVVRNEVAKFSKLGEVLFMDDRQLLTFHYLPPVPFVPDYEKKYMMDQAMANNARYFASYYQDLAKKRFALIVTEPLRTKRREELGGPFSEENDAWVVWVSNPTLCFYEPIYVSTDVNVELLIPKENPSGCEEYLK
jgi:hypothetical protein